MFFKKLSVKISIMFLVIIIPIFITLFLIFFKWSDSLRDRHLEISNQFLHGISSNESNTLIEMQNFYEKIFFADSDIIRFSLLQEKNLNYETTKQRVVNKFNMYLTNMENVEACIMHFPSNDESIVIAKTSGVLKSNWYEELMQDSSPEDLEKYDWKPIEIDEKSYLLKYFFVQSNVEAAILVDTQQWLESFISENNSFVFDYSGSLIAKGKDKEEMLSETDIEILSEAALSDNEIKELELSGEKYYFTKEKLFGANIWFVMLIAHNELYDTSFFYIMFLILGIVFPLIIGVTILLLHRWVSVPMRSLTGAMSKIGEDGDVSITVKKTGSYEFDFLADRFSQMLSQIKHLQIDAREKRIALADAEIKILQSQINPHFFMNTLNIITSLAKLKNFELIFSITSHLADYFRFIQSVNRETVTCAEEVKHLENYLAIQKLRYNGWFDYNFQISESHMNILIPPLTLQPFVENSVRHGYIKKEDTFTINVTSFDDEDNICFIISDNGFGISSEKIEELSNMDKENYQYKNIGIWNVQQRLMKYFGWVDIQFKSEPKKETIVTITIPRK